MAFKSATETLAMMFILLYKCLSKIVAKVANPRHIVVQLD
jgi:hypothetical protein